MIIKQHNAIRTTKEKYGFVLHSIIQILQYCECTSWPTKLISLENPDCISLQMLHQDFFWIEKHVLELFQILFLPKREWWTEVSCFFCCFYVFFFVVVLFFVFCLVTLQTGLFVIQFSGKNMFVLSNLKVPWSLPFPNCCTAFYTQPLSCLYWCCPHCCPLSGSSGFWLL